MTRWHVLEILVTDELVDQEAVFAERLSVLQEAIEERLSAKMSAPEERLTRLAKESLLFSSPG